MANLLSNLTSSIKSYLKDDNVGIKPSPQGNFLRVRSSGPTSSPQQSSFSDRVQQSFKSGFSKFREDEKAGKAQFQNTVRNLVGKLDRNKEQPGFQFRGAKIAPPPSLSLPTKFKPASETFKQEQPQRTLLNAPKRLVTGLAKNAAYTVTHPGEIVNVAKQRLNEASKFAPRLGESFALPGTMDLFEEAQTMARNQADLYTKKAIEANQAGDKERAKRFFDAAQNELNRANLASQGKLNDLETGKQELITGGAAMANLAAAAYNPTGALKTTVGGAILNTALNEAFGEPDPQAFIKGLDSTSKWAGLVNISNPIISGSVSKWAGGINNPFVKNITARALSGFGNVLEDRGIAAAYQDEGAGAMPNWNDVASFGIGFILQGGGTDSKEWDSLVKELTTTGLKESDAKTLANYFKDQRANLDVAIKNSGDESGFLNLSEFMKKEEQKPKAFVSSAAQRIKDPETVIRNLPEDWDNIVNTIRAKVNSQNPQTSMTGIEELFREVEEVAGKNVVDYINRNTIEGTDRTSAAFEVLDDLRTAQSRMTAPPEVTIENLNEPKAKSRLPASYWEIGQGPKADPNDPLNLRSQEGSASLNLLVPGVIKDVATVNEKADYLYKLIAPSDSPEAARFNIQNIVDDIRARGDNKDFQAFKRAIKEYKKLIVSGPGIPRRPEFDALFKEIEDLEVTNIKDFKLAPQLEPEGIVPSQRVGELGEKRDLSLDGSIAEKTGAVDVIPASLVESGLPKDFQSKINRETPKIKELEESIKRGDKLPPVPVYEENGKYFTNKDGDNRLIAYQNVGAEQIPVDIQPKTDLTGTQKQALERAKAEQSNAVKNYNAQLPNYLEKAKPRYNYGQKAFIPQFESDIDKALYITAQTKKSANDSGYRDFLKENGFTDAEIEKGGADIRAKIKAFAKDAPGGTYRDPEVVLIERSRDQEARMVEPEKTEISTEEAIAQKSNTATMSPADAQALATATQPAGGPTDVVDATRPQAPETAKDALSQQMKAFQEQQAALRANGEQISAPQIDQTVLDDATTRLFGKAEPLPPEVPQTEIPIRNQQLRKTYTSMMESDSVSNAYKEQYLKDRPDRFYDVRANEESIRIATETIQSEGVDATLNRVMEKGIDINEPQDMATAVVLHKMLEDQGNREGASALFGSILDKATKAGQSSQMLALIDKMGPSAMVEAAHSYIEGSIDQTKPGILGGVLEKFGVGAGRLTGYANTKEAADNLLNNVAQNINKLETPEAKTDFVSKLIDNNKILSKEIKNKDDFIKRIVKLANKSDQDSLFNMAEYTDIQDALMKELGIPHMDKAFANYIYDEAARIQKMDDVNAKNRATRELIKKINEKVPLTLQEVHRAYRYNNVLSGLGTHQRNIYENIVKVAVYQPTLIGLEELSQGRILKAVTEPVKFYRDVFSNLSEGGEGFIKAMKGDVYPDKFSLSGERSEILPAWLQVTKRLLEGEDQFFNIPLTNALEQRYIRQGVDASQARNLAEIEASEMLYKGGYDPQNKTGQGDVLSAMDRQAIKLESFIRGNPIGDRIVMFPRIATKIAKSSFEFSPLGFTTRGGSRNPSMQSIKAGIGTSAFLYGITAALSGNARGAAPDDKEGKTAFYAEGPAWTVDMGGQNVPIKYFGPTAFSVKAGIYLVDQLTKNPKLVDKTFAEKFVRSVLGANALIADETYLDGINNALEAFEGVRNVDPYAVDKFIGQNLEQELPFSGLQAWVNKFIDPEKRKGGSMLETAVRRMPVLSQGAESYTLPSGEPARVDYEQPGLNILNNFRPYDITPQRPEYREIVAEREEGQLQNAIEKAEENADDPTYLDRLSGAQAAETAGFQAATEVPDITTETKPKEKQGFLSRLFGKKDDTNIDTTQYNPGDLVAEASNDVMDVIAMSGNKTMKVPKDQELFGEKYKDIAKVIDNYKTKQGDILFDDTLKPAKQNSQLKDLAEEYASAVEAQKVLEDRYPTQVLDAQITTYGTGSDAGVENRGDWAVNKLTTTEKGSEDWQTYVNKLWEGGVLTGRSTGTLQYILDTYPGLSSADFKYTGDDTKVAKTAGSSAGTGVKKFTPTKIRAASAPEIIIPKTSFKIPTITAPESSYMSLGQGLPALPSSDFLRVQAPKIDEIPKLQIQRRKIVGLS